MVFLGNASAQEVPSLPPPPARLSVPSDLTRNPNGLTFVTPLPAHAQAQACCLSTEASFTVDSSKHHQGTRFSPTTAPAKFLLPEDKASTPLTPELANLNLPVDTTLVAKETGENIILPAGTYRQILQLPIDSPLLQKQNRNRELHAPPHPEESGRSKYSPPPIDPIWVRYESLEKIKIDGVERRGGLDIPSHSPELEPRVWYAKSESTDAGSAFFYFLFGGLGYGAANAAGWSAGNVREISNKFEYRLIRR